MKVTFIHRNGREQMMQRRYADVLQKLGRGTYMTRDMRAQPVVEPVNTEDDALTALRAEYHAVVGRRAHHSWDADTIRRKMAEADQEED